LPAAKSIYPPAAKSIYPPAADSNGNSAIHVAALRAHSGIPAIFELWLLLRKSQGNVDAGLLPLRLLRKQLAAPAIAIRGGLRHWILSATKSIYPPAADSNGNSAIRGAYGGYAALLSQASSLYWVR
jgi:hypothetical protein